MRRIPIYDATAPIACTADAASLAERAELLAELGPSVERIERTEHGVVLHFADDVEALVRRFVADEQACCGFWGFAITTDPLLLRWDGPPAAAGFLDTLLGALR